MDLVYLYHRQQIELMRSDRAACPASRVAHRDLADLYTLKIARQKNRRSAARQFGKAA